MYKQHIVVISIGSMNGAMSLILVLRQKIQVESENLPGSGIGKK